jgi:ribose transport system substrate-binding protein
VLVINVKPGISTTDARAKGFEEELKNYPNMKSLGVEYSNDKPEIAAAKASAALAAHPDLVGIFGTNLFSAEGAATGLRSAGASEKVKIVDFDAGSRQVEDLEQGIVQALIAQKPADIGKAGVEQAIHALKGEPVQKKIGTGFVVVTKENMNNPDVKPFLQVELLSATPRPAGRTCPAGRGSGVDPGRRSAQGRARSSWAATRSSRSSRP